MSGSSLLQSNRILTALLLPLLSLSGINCFYTTEVYDKKEIADNGLVSYTEPRYESRMTVLAPIVLLGGTVAGLTIGAYAGEQESSGNQAWMGQTLGLLMGGVVGGLVTTAIMVGTAPKVPEPPTTDSEAMEWLENEDDDLAVLAIRSDSLSTTIWGLDRSSADSFVPANGTELRLFEAVFAGPLERERIATAAATTMDRSELPAVVEVYPETEGAVIARRRYLFEAPTIGAVVEASRRYPGMWDTAATVAAEKLDSRDDLLQFEAGFYGDTNLIVALNRILPGLNRSDLLLLLRSLSTEAALEIVGASLLEQAENVSDAVDVARKVPALRANAFETAKRLAKSDADRRLIREVFGGG